jgi:hypothetical protein
MEEKNVIPLAEWRGKQRIMSFSIEKAMSGRSLLHLFLIQLPIVTSSYSILVFDGGDDDDGQQQDTQIDFIQCKQNAHLLIEIFDFL